MDNASFTAMLQFQEPVHSVSADLTLVGRTRISYGLLFSHSHAFPQAAAAGDGILTPRPVAPTTAGP